MELRLNSLNKATEEQKAKQRLTKKPVRAGGHKLVNMINILWEKHDRQVDQLINCFLSCSQYSGCYDDQLTNHIGQTLHESVKGQSGPGRGSAGWWWGPLQAGQR